MIEKIKHLGHLCEQTFYEMMLNSTESFPTPQPDGAYDLIAYEIGEYQWLVSSPKYKQYKYIFGDKNTGKLYEKTSDTK